MTPNDVEAGSIWDARQAYNNMLARRRKQEAMRSIFYYVSTKCTKYEYIKDLRIYITKKCELKENIADLRRIIHICIIHTYIYICTCIIYLSTTR